ncbi:NUMOD4 domain-containing protein [Clostridium butyricum]|uniref:NUMOD4 domain-containing protein n=1 Tax=Clostridium butyricum TaxID=1492 RepID=UPI00189CB655|nr:NUMOD4 domain-containing protein [Clostridium butyricum]MDB2151186.1 NUMOD4 domain-containing protein [Clostridium butyricum]MDU3584094.1 NUMOD4 domain-containing protein [Clostridium butyricum]MDU3595607.1 NUMOD4 domain-containing protein [Clostridium butyricum]
MFKYEIVNLQNEVWRNVIGYEGFYLISNMGRVISTGKKRNYEKSREHRRRLL